MLVHQTLECHATVKCNAVLSLRKTCVSFDVHCDVEEASLEALHTVLTSVEPSREDRTLEMINSTVAAR